MHSCSSATSSRLIPYTEPKSAPFVGQTHTGLPQNLSQYNNGREISLIGSALVRKPTVMSTTDQHRIQMITPKDRENHQRRVASTPRCPHVAAPRNKKPFPSASSEPEPSTLLIFNKYPHSSSNPSAARHHHQETNTRAPSNVHPSKEKSVG